jgi:hypothetical protein
MFSFICWGANLAPYEEKSKKRKQIVLALKSKDVHFRLNCYPELLFNRGDNFIRQI